MSKVGSSLYSRLHGIFKESPIATVKSTKPRSQFKSKKFPSKSKETVASSASGGDLVKSSNEAEGSKLTKKLEKFKRSCESDSFRQVHGLYSAFIRRLREAKKFSMIDQALQYQKKFDDIKSEDFVIRIMLLYGYSGMADHAHKLFDEMPELNCERTVKSFNALLSAYVNSRKLDEAMKAFKELPEMLGITPDLVTYNTMIKALCRKGSMDDILSIFEELETNGFEPDLITFNTLLEEFYRRDLFAEGDRIWDLMKSKNLVPNIRSYNSRMRGLTRNKKFTDAINLMDVMKTEEVSPDVHTYNAFITAYRGDNNLEEAMKWYSEMKEKRLTPDSVTYCLLIPLVCKKGDLDIAVEISEEAIKHKVLSRPNMYKPVIERLMGEGKIDKATQLVKDGKLQSYFRYLPDLSTGKKKTSASPVSSHPMSSSSA
ncbi:hypothetical protein AALP_AA3G142400 [Arabis alpina]|uniref:Pentacotripeptide-repeat region of PRORP domain-containing protein n=1 Tax=Arabis alpina TaxID=50452 RepID=A0A087H947_ARAAL|nr:hypothetical protein AALP_AA3G142400 [Arabis alpina]